MSPCTEESELCDRAAIARGLCAKHYYRARRRGLAPSKDRTPDTVLAVARAHGTSIAMAWSGWSRSKVLGLRQRADGYSRGRGHPSSAEMAAMAYRRCCSCPRCSDVRDAELARAGMLETATGPKLTDARFDWQENALCRGLLIDLWFPVEANPTYENARPVCEACPVSDRCLKFALTNHIPFGMFGGASPQEREHMRPAQSEEAAA